VGWERPDKGWERKKRKEKKEKRKRKRKRKRVLWGFYPFYLPGEAVLPNGQKKNSFSSPSESDPQVKPQLKLF
jgi:hypothetical protein